MKYSRNLRVQWYDTDANRVVSASRMMVYMMETANVQCEEYDFGLDKLRDERGLGFVLGSIQANFKKPLHTNDEITVRTWCKEARGYSFLRYFEIVRDGEVVAEAASTWALLDINNRTMVRGDESFDGHFLIDEPLDAQQLPRRARATKKELTVIGQRRIVYSDIDYNMHMNNTHYPDMICDFLPDMIGKRISKMSLTYAREAPLGASLTVLRSEPLSSDGTGEFELRTLDKDGNTCLEAIVEVENI
ncbi:MAG: thioesterase family protein [Clostridia bacterium]|nr:thioesterase family protein [Clostridia bacterium]